MARTKSISDERILEAARETFLEHGMQATSAQIARRAAVSEGTLFRRFESKQTLFMACMGLAEPPFFGTLDELAGQGDLRENLIRLGEEMLDFFEELIPRITMITSCGMLHELSSDPDEIPPVRGLRKVTAFFEIEMCEGRVREANPEVVARLWIGGLHHYAFQHCLGLNEFMPLPRETYLHGVVDLLLGGLKTEEVP